MAKTQLYLITPPAFDVDDFAHQLTAALDGGAVASVQLRLKKATDAQIIRAARILMPLCQAKDVAFIINNRPDLARMLGADGVHLGQNDMIYAQAREIVGPDKIIGVTCHNSRHLSMTAAEAGAEYVAFGAFYPSDTKNDSSPADISILSWWVELCEVPCVAIGGITVDNAAPVIATGTDFIAISSGIWNHEQGPKAAVAQFHKLMI